MSLLGGLYGLGEEAKRLEVWQRTTTPAGLAFAHSEWGIDQMGRLLRYADYGDRTSQYGWELDHWPLPKVAGGGDHVGNLRALHWHANASLGGIAKQIASLTSLSR